MQSWSWHLNSVLPSQTFHQTTSYRYSACRVWPRSLKATLADDSLKEQLCQQRELEMWSRVANPAHLPQSFGEKRVFWRELDLFLTISHWIRRHHRRSFLWCHTILQQGVQWYVMEWRRRFQRIGWGLDWVSGAAQARVLGIRRRLSISWHENKQRSWNYKNGPFAIEVKHDVKASKQS